MGHFSPIFVRTLQPLTFLVYSTVAHRLGRDTVVNLPTLYYCSSRTHCLDMDPSDNRPFLEGCTNREWPIQPISRFLVKLPKWHSNPCMKFDFFLDQMTSFEVFNSLMNFIHKVPLTQSKCLSKWIKVDKWDYFQNRPQDFFFSYYIFQFLFLFLNKKPLSEVAPGLLVIHIQIQVV